MGTWDVGPFDNDAARDWLARARHPDDVADALRRDTDETFAAVGVVAWAAGVLPDPGVPRQLTKHRRALRGLQTEGARACERLLADSEVRTLWEESGGLATWADGCASLIRSLGGVVPPRDESTEADGEVPATGAPEPAIDLPAPIADIYKRNRSAAAHAAFPYELSQPRFLRHHPAELLVLGVHRKSEELLVVETHEDLFLRLLHWSQDRGATSTDLLDDWCPDPPGETTCFSTVDGCHLWMEEGTGAANLLSARNAWLRAYRSDDLRAVEEAERVLAQAQHEMGRSRQARHHADAGRLVEVALDKEPVLLKLAGSIYGTRLADRDRRLVEAALLTSLRDLLLDAGLVDEEAVTRAAARCGDISALLLTNADDAVVEQACVAASPRQVLDALEETRNASVGDRLRRSLATKTLARGMDSWTVAEVESLLGLGATATPFARRKAKRRRDHEQILSLLTISRQERP